MKLRTKLAAIGSTVAALGTIAAVAPAHAADQLVSTTVVGTITLSTPPAPSVLVPPASLPGNATGTSAMVVTANTAYHVAVKSAAGLVGATTNHSLAAMSVTPSMLVVPNTYTLTSRTVGTSDATIVSSPGGLADAYTLSFSQPLTAGDPLDAYSGTLTYTVSAGL